MPIDQDIPGRHMSKAWELWNIRVGILFSLLWQIILFLGAPMGKRTGDRLVILLVSWSYFYAELATSFAVGLITSIQSSKHGETSDLYAFWASFVLLHHIGGPDTITASVENELWPRQLVTIISQVFATLLIFPPTLPESKLWLPTSLIFFAGIIKCGERTRSLYLADWRKFRETMLPKPDPGPEYAKLMESLSSKKKARLPTAMSQEVEAVIKESKVAFNCDPQQSVKKESLTYFEVVKYAYKHFHNTLVGLVVDLTGRHDRHASRSFFCNLAAEDALEVLEVELNFIYEILDTKVYVVHSLTGYIFRLLTILSVWASLAIFCLDCKQGLDKFDIGITYTLLIFASSLETIALFNLIFSDWITASLDQEKTNPCVWTIFDKYLKIRRSRWATYMDVSGNKFDKRATSVLFRRWSESVAGFNLITYCLRQLPKNSHGENKICRQYVVEPLGAQDFLDELKYASKNPFTEDLWRLIFYELHGQSGKVEEPENTGKMSSARGAYVLEEYRNKATGGDVVLFETLKTDYIENVTFDESLLLWHIATELCYHGSEVDHDKFISKLLSDYMLYLLVMKPTMMSAVTGIGQIRYRDTCAEAERFFRNKGLGPNDRENVACENLLAVNTEVKPIYVKGDKSKSVLFDACMLAKELQKLEKKKWKVISEVWVEMLAYASNHCKPDAHTEQVSRGGQLINLVWLLMAHFGLAKQFAFSTTVGPAKLIVGK
ncbi:hypothetical protein CIPAW_15G052600 [Carya illinoinensis]|uniref:DUF4220 domain-containing protein n=1 Tax=Carya illinoinensis TaxID=32201 RepID=A0A8T1NCE9_CARIL|nr:hypothetical protein CIPAW_15G052600 [Carya illinoinensis]